MERIIKKKESEITPQRNMAFSQESLNFSCRKEKADAPHNYTASRNLRHHGVQ